MAPLGDYNDVVGRVELDLIFNKRWGSGVCVCVCITGHQYMRCV